jgi:hypothetical protein
MRTIEAVIDESGQVHLLEPVRLSAKSRALVTILENEPPAVTLRPFGLCAGEFVVPDDFDDPLPEDILQAFESE